MSVTDAEIQHGVALLRQASSAEAWGGPVAVIPIDEVCKWDDGDGPCREPLRNVVLLQWTNKEGSHAVAFCGHHSECMRKAVEHWRTLS